VGITVGTCTIPSGPRPSIPFTLRQGRIDLLGRWERGLDRPDAIFGNGRPFIFTLPHLAGRADRRQTGKAKRFVYNLTSNIRLEKLHPGFKRFIID
jgi:hypothetical protein